MALVNQGWVLTITLADIGANKSSLKYVLVAADHTAAAAARGVIVGALDVITNAAIVKTTLSELEAEDTVFLGLAEGENIAQITAKIDDPQEKTVNIRIPAPVPAIFTDTSGPGYNVIDPTNAALIAYLEVWETGGQATISDGESLADMSASGTFKGKRVHRASTSG